MNDLVTLLMNAGSTVVIVAYFIYRDLKFMQKLDGTLDVIVKLVEEKERDGDGK